MRRERAHELVGDRRRQAQRHQARVHGWRRRVGCLQRGTVGGRRHQAAARRDGLPPPRAHAGEIQPVLDCDVDCARKRALDAALGGGRFDRRVDAPGRTDGFGRRHLPTSVHVDPTACVPGVCVCVCQVMCVCVDVPVHVCVDLPSACV